jgi:DNA invertase Pin-like site-specific DNA recombinase
MSRRERASQRPGDELLVSRLEDLAGSLEDLAGRLRRMQSRGVGLRLAGELSAACEAEARGLVKGMLLAADFQARLTEARAREAIVGARQSGLFPPGRPRTLNIERIATLRAAGLGAAAIAAELGVARSSVYRKLKEIEAPETRRRRPQAASPNCNAASRA